MRFWSLCNRSLARLSRQAGGPGRRHHIADDGRQQPPNPAPGHRGRLEVPSIGNEKIVGGRAPGGGR
ncbi:hypothetical protein EVAR_73954_1, partial [Eumeta japonica]